MATYYYEGVNKSGKQVKGVKEAISKQSLLSELAMAGIFVSTVKENKAGRVSFAFSIFRHKKNLADYFFQLSLLLRSGIPLVEAQGIIEKSTKNPKEKEIIMDVTSRVSEGVRFSDALGRHKDFYDPMYVNLVKASEKVGRLPQVLMDIAEYEENKRKTSDALKSALIYPLTIFVLGMGVLAFLLTVIVPRMQSIFDSAKQQLPAITRALLAISGFFRSYGIFVLILIIALIVGFIYAYRINKKFRYKIDKKLFSIGLIAQNAMIRFTHILAFQLKEGLPLSDALFYANQTVNNVYMREVLEGIRNSVQEGIRFSVAVKNAEIFPDLFPAAVSTGESSGNLPELLERVTEFFSKKIDKYTTSFLSIIEPLFIVFIGGMVGFVIVAIMIPLFNINTLVG